MTPDGVEYRRHVGMRDFGTDVSTYGEYSSIRELVLTRTIPDDISKSLSLLEEYDKTFDLYDHSQDEDLLSIMYMHPEEDPITGSRSIALMNEILGLRLPELTGESLSDLMNYPRHILDHLISKATKYREREAKAYTAPP